MDSESPNPVVYETDAPQATPNISLSMADLKQLVSGAVREAVAEATAPLVAQNARLQEELQKVSATGYADGVPQHLRRHDPNVDPSRLSVARSVTLATRPVVENPDQYQNVVDPGGLSINNAMRRED